MNEQYVLEVNHMKKILLPNENMKDKGNGFTLEDINFALEPGYILGIVGRNGAGKTTLLQTILGIYRPDEGSIKICGKDRVTEGAKAKRQIAFIMDECLFPLDLMPLDIGKMFGPLYTGFDEKKYINYLKQFQVPPKKTLRKQSRGMKVKVQLAFCLSYDARLYVFDEATAGLDPVFRKELMELFFEIVKDGTKSIILSTHLTEDLDKIADYILYLDNGKQEFFMDKETLLSKYLIIRGSRGQIDYYGKYILGRKDEDIYSEALIEKPSDEDNFPVLVKKSVPAIEEIMVYYMQRKGEK